MASIVWSDDAVADFESIFLYFLRTDPNYADFFRVSLLEKVSLLKEFPLMGRKAFHSNEPNDREIFFQSYRIVYNFKNDIISIISIIHTSRAI